MTDENFSDSPVQLQMPVSNDYTCMVRVKQYDNHFSKTRSLPVPSNGTFIVNVPFSQLHRDVFPGCT